MRHFVRRLPCALFAAGLAMPLLLAGCGRAAPAADNPIMTLLHDGSEKVCVADDVRAALRNLIVPKPADFEGTYEVADVLAAIKTMSLSYELTTLKSVDAAVSRATCNAAVRIQGVGGKSGKYRLDYEISPAAENPGSFVVTATTDDPAAFARTLVEQAAQTADDARTVQGENEYADQQRRELLAVITEKWLVGAWIGAGAATAACGNGNAIWFEPAHVLEGALGKGRWALAGDQLHLVGGDARGFDVTGTITEADAISFELTKSDGSYAMAFRRCTRAETEALPQATDDGIVPQ